MEVPQVLETIIICVGAYCLGYMIGALLNTLFRR